MPRFWRTRGFRRRPPHSSRCAATFPRHVCASTGGVAGGPRPARGDGDPPRTAAGRRRRGGCLRAIRSGHGWLRTGRCLRDLLRVIGARHGTDACGRTPRRATRTSRSTSRPPPAPSSLPKTPRDCTGCSNITLSPPSPTRHSAPHSGDPERRLDRLCGQLSPDDLGEGRTGALRVLEALPPTLRTDVLERLLDDDYLIGRRGYAPGLRVGGDEAEQAGALAEPAPGRACRGGRTELAGMGSGPRASLRAALARRRASLGDLDGFERTLATISDTHLRARTLLVAFGRYPIGRAPRWLDLALDFTPRSPQLGVRCSGRWPPSGSQSSPSSTADRVGRPVARSIDVPPARRAPRRPARPRSVAAGRGRARRRTRAGTPAHASWAIGWRRPLTSDFGRGEDASRATLRLPRRHLTAAPTARPEGLRGAPSSVRSDEGTLHLTCVACSEVRSAAEHELERVGLVGGDDGTDLAPRSTAKPAFLFGRFLSRLSQYRGLPVPQKRHLPDQRPLISMRWRPWICVSRDALGTEWK